MILETAVLGWGLYNKLKASRVAPRNVEAVRQIEAERLRIEAERLRLQELRERSARRHRSVWNVAACLTLMAGGWAVYHNREAIRSFVTPKEVLTVEAAQKQAVRRYPELGVAGSALNKAYLARYRTYQATQPEFFRNPAWPITLAHETAQATSSR